MISRNSQSKGFTLSELLVVVGILAILSTAFLINLNPLGQFVKGYDAVRKADLAKIKNAFESYYSDHDCYPPQSVLSQCGSNALDPYLTTIPCDPNTRSPYKIYYGDYEGSACPQKYVVYADLSNKVDPAGNKIPYCANTIASNSPGTRDADIIKGCSNKSFVSTYYGCKNGACVLVAQDYDPPPSTSVCNKVFPNDPTCNKGRDCAIIRRGKYLYNCSLP